MAVVSFLPFSPFFFSFFFFISLLFFDTAAPRGNIVLLYERVPKKRKLPKFRIARNATAGLSRANTLRERAHAE